MFPDGPVNQYAAKVIAESMIYNEVDEDDRKSQILDEIVDLGKKLRMQFRNLMDLSKISMPTERIE